MCICLLVAGLKCADSVLLLLDIPSHSIQLNLWLLSTGAPYLRCTVRCAWWMLSIWSVFFIPKLMIRPQFPHESSGVSYFVCLLAWKQESTLLCDWAFLTLNFLHFGSDISLDSQVMNNRGIFIQCFLSEVGLACVRKMHQAFIWRFNPVKQMHYG